MDDYYTLGDHQRYLFEGISRFLNDQPTKWVQRNKLSFSVDPSLYTCVTSSVTQNEQYLLYTTRDQFYNSHRLHQLQSLHHSTSIAYRLRSEEHTSELQSRGHLVCRLLLEKKNYTRIR